VKLLKEPLLHFVVIGAALFAVHHWFVSPQERTNVVEIDKQRMAGLELEFERTHGRTPTTEELNAATQAYVEDEIFYREALSLGLHNNDPVVRRRLIQQIQLLAEQNAVRDKPSDEQLKSWLKEHQKKYRQPASVTLEHVFFSNEKSDYVSRSQSALPGKQPTSTGEPFALGRRLTRWTEARLEKQFGAEFAAKVLALEPRQWAGPLISKFGAHLVNVLERVDAAPAELNRVRQRVQTDYMAERRIEARRQAVERMLKRYTVTTE